MENKFLPIIDNNPNYYPGFSLAKLPLAMSILMIFPSIWSIYKFGLSSIILTTSCIFLTILLDYILIRVFKKETLNSYFLGYSVMNGFIVAMVQTPNTPLYIPIIAIFITFVLNFSLSLNKIFLSPVMFGILFSYVIFQDHYIISNIDSTSSASIMTSYKQSGFNSTSLETFSDLVSNLDKTITVFINNQFFSKFDLNVSFIYVSLFFGNLGSSLGGSSFLILLVIYIVLFSSNMIQSYLVSIFYFTSFLVLSYVFGGIFSLGFSIDNLFKGNPLFDTLSGGFMFSLVFLVSNPFFLPISKLSMILYGILLGVILFLFKYISPYPDGVIFSVCISSLIIFIFDSLFINVKRVWI